MRNIKGFTLIELLLVVVLLGMLTVTAFSTLFNARENFAFLSEYKPIVSMMQTARLYATNNREGEVYDRYGIEINSDGMMLFADAGTGVPFEYDLADRVEETLNIDEAYGIEFLDGELPVYLFYENGSGEMTSYETVGGDLVLMEKAVVKRLDFRFTVADGGDLNKYFYVFQVSGIVEESDTPFF